MESASYIENSTTKENEDSGQNEIISKNDTGSEEFTPKLFAEDNNTDFTHDSEINNEEISNDKLFDQDTNNEDEDFEIPAFLRKQKF